MQKYKKPLVGLMLILLVFGFGFVFGKGKAQEDLESKLEVYLQVLSLVKNNYVEKNVDNTNIVYGSIRGLLDSLDDPYSRFMEPKDYKEMQVRLRGSYNGIGIYIGMKDKQLMVISPIKGTPAHKMGLKSKDRIATIDGKPTRDMALEQAVSLIRGPRGTKVKLGILRGDAKDPKDYAIVRDKIEIKSTEYKMIGDSIAYIKLNTFEKKDSPKEVKAAIDAAKKKGAKGLIVDVRNNGGGLLDNAIDIGSMFIKKGAIVQTVDREGMRDVQYSNGQFIWDRPLVVLVNGASASASEILAGALRDNHVAPLVGAKTFGKASVQSVRVLQDGSAVLLTIAKYLTPSGEDISKKGIEPDYAIELPTEEADALLNGDDAKDIQLQKAIDVLKEKIRGSIG
ncbi:MAG: PDZ domain-containing protein [Candidatus Margulisbacteria bacterium]|nr:PDZ domain-containing protein [Candidatus Margulisiibacteriota bacterium]